MMGPDGSDLETGLFHEGQDERQETDKEKAGRSRKRILITVFSVVAAVMVGAICLFAISTRDTSSGIARFFNWMYSTIVEDPQTQWFRKRNRNLLDDLAALRHNCEGLDHDVAPAWVDFLEFLCCKMGNKIQHPRGPQDLVPGSEWHFQVRSVLEAAQECDWWYWAIVNPDGISDDLMAESDGSVQALWRQIFNFSNFVNQELELQIFPVLSSHRWEMSYVTVHKAKNDHRLQSFCEAFDRCQSRRNWFELRTSRPAHWVTFTVAKWMKKSCEHLRAETGGTIWSVGEYLRRNVTGVLSRAATWAAGQTEVPHGSGPPRWASAPGRVVQERPMPQSGGWSLTSDRRLPPPTVPPPPPPPPQRAFSYVTKRTVPEGYHETPYGPAPNWIFPETSGGLSPRDATIPPWWPKDLPRTQTFPNPNPHLS